MSAQSPPVCETSMDTASQLTKNYMPSAIRPGSKIRFLLRKPDSAWCKRAPTHSWADKPSRRTKHFVTKSEQGCKQAPAGSPLFAGERSLFSARASERLFREHYSRTKPHGDFGIHFRIGQIIDQQAVRDSSGFGRQRAKDFG